MTINELIVDLQIGKQAIDTALDIMRLAVKEGIWNGEMDITQSLRQWEAEIELDDFMEEIKERNERPHLRVLKTPEKEEKSDE